MDTKIRNGLIVAILLPILIVTPIGITNAVRSSIRGDDFLQNRVEWSLQLSYEIYNVNGTNLCGCNHTDSMLIINASLSEWDDDSYYCIYFNDPYVKDNIKGKRGEDYYFLWINPINPYVEKIRLNSTCLTNGKELYRNPFFNNWTEEHPIYLHEYFKCMYKVICFWHSVSFEEDTLVATFSISNGFSSSS